jgi:hypothetical protein
MAPEGSNPFRQSASVWSRAGPRAIPTSWFVAALVVAIVSILLLGVVLLAHPAPGTQSSRSLLWTQAQDVNALYQSEFTVPSASDSGAPVPVLIVATVNVSCGGPSYLGPDYVCDLSLVSGATGGPSENLLWDLSFSGQVVTNESNLIPGLYTLSIHVVIGSPPAVVIYATFNTTLAVTSLS